MTRRVRNGAGFVGARTSVAGEPRRPGDYYPTIDEDVTRALIIAEGARIRRILGRRSVVEPACGAGHMVRTLESEGFPVAASDIDPQGCGRRADFLSRRRRGGVYITNPPFSLAIEFIEHALALGADYLALLLKADFWQVGDTVDPRRQQIWRRSSPSVVYPLTWRPDFTRGGKGRPFLNLAWNVWVEPSIKRMDTTYRLLAKSGVVGVHV